MSADIKNQREEKLNTNANLSVVMAISETLIAKDIKDSVRDIRLKALMSLQSQLKRYKELGYCDKLLDAIEEKKVQMILRVTSKTEMSKVLKPHCPYFDGNQFIPDSYNIPEEELICWSETSLKTPLNEAGFKRYLELFESIFPEKNLFYGFNKT